MITTINFERYKDKVHGAWVGKCAGGILGAPIEGYKRFNTIELNDKLFENNFANDDLDLQLLWLDMILHKGVDVRASDFKEHWLNHVAFPWNEYGIATRNIRIGLDNPDSGSHNNYYWKHSMGSPIRSEIWGLVCAGNPEKAVFYAKMDSTLDHEGFSVEAEQYLSACMALAFLENDVNVILTKALNYISTQSECAQLVRSIMYWNTTFGVETALGKVKSLYGDADFTSAPMNIGFTILSILNSEGKIDNLNTALHYGHDSDCIVATAGSLLGAIMGYKAIPETWKERVGNDILVSPEVSGIALPSSITQLTDLTCEAALPFLMLNPKFEIKNYPNFKHRKIERKEYAVHTEIKTFPSAYSLSNGSVRVSIENLQCYPLKLTVQLKSDFFADQHTELYLSPNEIVEFDLILEPQSKGKVNRPSLKYVLEIEGTNKRTFEKGIPNYGKWLLLGPFMEDDQELAPMSKDYPDHGMSSLPSVKYMNHDKQKPASQFIIPSEIPASLLREEIDKLPFGVQEIFPSSMMVNLGDYFYGTGERTLYLYTQIICPKKVKKWLCLGHSNYATVWLNSTKLNSTSESRRRWPGTENIELELDEGQNHICIRFDFTNDDFLVHIGLKEHQEKHPHQSQWDTELLFNF